MKILLINTGLTKIVIALTILFVTAGSGLAGGKGGGKGGGKTPTPFIDGFYDSRTPGVLCPWEQLNACEGRKEVFVVSETKKANGTNYYLDYDAAQEGHIDVCMNAKDAPGGLVFFGLTPLPIDLDIDYSDNGCYSPCNMLVRQKYTNRLSCHENGLLDQSQGLLNFYSLETLSEYTRPGDNYFCHVDYLPPNIMPDQCWHSTSKYCFRSLEAGESGDEYEAYLEECLSNNWIE